MMVEVETVAIAKKIHELLAIAEAAALERAARVVEEDHRSSPETFDCASTASRIRALHPGSLLEDFEKGVREDERQRVATVALPVSSSLLATPPMAAAVGAGLPVAPAVSSSALPSASGPAASAPAAAAPSISSGRSIFSVRSNGSGASNSRRTSQPSESSKNGNSNGHWYSKTIEWLQGNI